MWCHPGAFQHRALPYLYHGFFACESISGREEKSCTSTKWLPGQLSGSFFECVKTVSDENSLVTVHYPPDSSYLALSDFCLFGHIKMSLAGSEFNNANELPEAAIKL
jgi:hypothetical protein